VVVEIDDVGSKLDRNALVHGWGSRTGKSIAVNLRRVLASVSSPEK
jgi:hypothetical protein